MPLRIAITGSTGLIGQAISSYFRERGDVILPLVRPSTRGITSAQNIIPWDPEKGWIDLGKLEGCDVLIHLAGANIAGHRWTPQYKEEIRNSRVQSTQLLRKTILSLQRPPNVWFCASAVGIYGDDFLSQVCAEWEDATSNLNRDVRVVNLRFGMVLAKEGGALAKMLPVFRVGLGGPVGSGQQMISWIALEEIPLIIAHLLEKEVAGAVDVVSPGAVSNREFTETLGKILHRPVVLPLPAFMVKLIFGEMGKSLLLSGVKVRPGRLMDSGYCFHHPDLESALEAILKL